MIDRGVPEENIYFLNIISCPEGLTNLTAKYPAIKIVTAEVDSHLNERSYIIPGIGDFGDRYFGTDMFDYIAPNSPKKPAKGAGGAAKDE